MPKILDTRVDGDLATVWAQVASETVERNGKSRKDNFSEVYLLVRTGGAWQIGAIADNRGTDSLVGRARRAGHRAGQAQVTSRWLGRPAPEEPGLHRLRAEDVRR